MLLLIGFKVEPSEASFRAVRSIGEVMEVM
jgi:hypothetical protein